MKKEQIGLLAVAVSLCLGLAMLPKVVVNSKSSREKDAKALESPKDAKPMDDKHEAGIGAEVQTKINNIKAKLSSSTGEAKIPVLQNLMQVFAGANKLDSAAAYAEEIVKINASEMNMLLAADTYYQAFGFAISQEKGQKLAEKTREYYEKALQKNPHLLKAKTNMAMTYVGSETPMQGIMLLREVLNEDPNYVPALMNMGLLSMQSNQFEKAVARFKSILKIEKSNTEAAFYLGICLVETGEKVEAKRILEQVQKQNPDPAIQEAIKETLQNLK